MLLRLWHRYVQIFNLEYNLLFYVYLYREMICKVSECTARLTCLVCILWAQSS